MKVLIPMIILFLSTTGLIVWDGIFTQKTFDYLENESNSIYEKVLTTDISDEDLQKRIFREQLALAKELDMPVIIHDRDAHEDTIEILEEYRPKGILHRYSGPVDILKRAFDLGMYISFNNDLTYPMWNAGPIACLMETPWDRLLIETDCPYAPPYERENDRCEAYDVANVVKVIAQLRGVSEEFVAQKAMENAMRVYEIKK